jgi:drug/metabolite transporter (DMT)-like permease
MSIRDWIKYILLSLLWGSSFLWIKIAIQEIGPFTLVAFRILFALLGFLGFFLISRPRLPSKEYIWVFVIMGLFNITVPFVLISWSEKFIPSGMASVLNSTSPLWTILIAPFFIAEDRLNFKKLVGLILGFSGVVVLVSNHFTDSSGNQAIAPLAMLAATFCYAATAVFSRLKLAKMDPIAQTAGTLSIAGLAIVPAALIFEAPLRLPQLPITWLALAWLGLLGTFGAFLLYYSLIHSIGPMRATAVTYVMALVGVILGILFLNEPPDWRLFAGGALIIGGIMLVNQRKRELVK